MYVVSDFLVTNEQLARPRGRARRERGGRRRETGRERRQGRQAEGQLRKEQSRQERCWCWTTEEDFTHSLHSSTHFVPGDRSFVVERISRFKELVKWGMGLVDSLMLYKMCYNPY